MVTESVAEQFVLLAVTVYVVVLAGVAVTTEPVEALNKELGDHV